jgi:hypothetical protein
METRIRSLDTATKDYLLARQIDGLSLRTLGEFESTTSRFIKPMMSILYRRGHVYFHSLLAGRSLLKGGRPVY